MGGMWPFSVSLLREGVNLHAACWGLEIAKRLEAWSPDSRRATESYTGGCSNCSVISHILFTAPAEVCLWPFTLLQSVLGLATLQLLHQLLNYILENALHVALTQCARHLRDASLTSREKQLLKRELATELNTFLSGMTKVVRKSLIGAGSSSSPKSKDRKSSSAFSSSTSTLATTIKDHQYINLVNVFIKQVLNK